MWSLVKHTHSPMELANLSPNPCLMWLHYMVPKSLPPWLGSELWVSGSGLYRLGTLIRHYKGAGGEGGKMSWRSLLTSQYWS